VLGLRLSRIRSRGNKTTEARMVELLRSSLIIGWRRHPKMLGSPDFVFRRQRVVLFIDGCFWHCCPQCFRPPASNEGYWGRKLARNVSRDRRNTRLLRSAGWSVLRIWEHDFDRPLRIVRRIHAALGASAATERTR